uniref:Uncharacterized protein n=1 Tax=Siphoviridae sp. ctoRD1 TaxID=2825669 RepID=A0A8S5QFF1_9CAUD|nr:MAG TPA: hypothetical protein [Siphoviridae sp. ctoRD1]
MVTVWMAILIFMGLGWQFAFEQWGITTDRGWDKDYWTFTYPIAMSSSLSAYIGRAAGGGSYSAIIKYLGSSELHWTDSGPDGKHGYGDTMYVIIIGH